MQLNEVNATQNLIHLNRNQYKVILRLWQIIFTPPNPRSYFYVSANQMVQSGFFISTITTSLRYQLGIELMSVQFHLHEDRNSGHLTDLATSAAEPLEAIA